MLVGQRQDSVGIVSNLFMGFSENDTITPVSSFTHLSGDHPCIHYLNTQRCGGGLLQSPSMASPHMVKRENIIR